jgi:hypothetical protein
LAGCTGTAVAAGNTPPKAGGGGVALARVGTLAELVPAPGGAAMATLGAPLETELKPCACAKPNGKTAAANASASRNGVERAWSNVIGPEFYSAPDVFAVSCLTPTA